MKTEIMIAVLALLCIGSMAAAFVLWAKVDELKKANVEERENYNAVLKLHNTTAEAARQLEAEKDALNGEIARLNQCLDTEFEFADAQIDKNREMQDRLSALLCPSNNHVWKDGVCAKCGRVKDALP